MYQCLVYISGPITAETRYKTSSNLTAGAKASERLWQMHRIPAFSPHAQSGDWSNWDQERDYYPTLAGDLVVIDRCNALYLLPEWQTSTGARIEVAYANWHNTKVFESEIALVDWVKVNFDFLEFKIKTRHMVLPDDK